MKLPDPSQAELYWEHIRNRPKGQLKTVCLANELDWKLSGYRIREQPRNSQVSLQGPGGSGEAEPGTQGQGQSGAVRAAWAQGPKELGRGARVSTQAVANCTFSSLLPAPAEGRLQDARRWLGLEVHTNYI